MSRATDLIAVLEAATKTYTPEDLASKPPKFVSHADIWKKIVLDKGHTTYGQAVSHYKSKLKAMGIEGL